MGELGFMFALKEADKGWNALVKTVQNIAEADAYVKVGVLEKAARVPTLTQKIKRAWQDAKGSKPKKPRQKKSSNRPSNAQIAAYHEFGAPKAGIPERSFIRSTFNAKRGEYAALITKLVKGIYDQKIDVEKALNVLGLRFATDIKKRITGGEIKQDLSARTLAAKEAKTRRGKAPKNGVKALIDTGQLVGAISWLAITGKNKDQGGDGGVKL